MLANRVVTIDMADVRTGVSNQTAPESLYNDWDYLNTNIQMPAFKALMERLQNLKADDSAEKLKAEFEKSLFDILEQWAYRAQRDDKYGIAAAHKAMIAANSTKEAKMAFIKKCSRILDNQGEEAWDHNQAEVLAGQVLLDIMEDKDPSTTLADLNSSISKYEKVSSEQVRKDIDRGGKFIFDMNGRVGYMNESQNPRDNSYEHFTPTKFPELTGEQMGFIKNLHGQGKLDGGWFSPLALTAGSGGLAIINANESGEAIPSNCFIMQDKGKTYLISSRKLEGVDADKGILSHCGTVTTIVDLSDLKGDKFTIGCASAEVPMRIVVDAPEYIIDALKLPGKPGMGQEDESLLKKASEVIPTAKQWGAMIREEHVEKLVDYLKKELKPGVTVDRELKRQMKEKVIEALKPIATDEKKLKALNETAGAIVRECVDIASKEDSSIGLSLGQKIRKVIVDSLKSFFSRNQEKKEFRDIVNEDFVSKLKAGILHKGAANASETQDKPKSSPTRGV